MLAIDTEGMHPTTEICIEALQVLGAQKHFTNILDMGCGNGLLSIISAGIWEADVLAADISPNAVRDARGNIAAHELERHITVVRSDGFKHALISQRAPYGLIVFNLLAESLIRMVNEVKKHISPNGYCILCGMLTWLSPGVEEAYRRAGFEITQRFAIEPWHGWIIRLKASPEWA